MSKIITMGFFDGGCGSLNSIIGVKDFFKSKEEFLNYCITKDEDLYTEFECNRDEDMEYTLDDVSENHVKYYDRLPEEFDVEEGYTFCSKDEEGAFEVYVLDVG